MKRRHLTGALVFLLCLSLISALSACSITDTGAPDAPTAPASDPTPALPEPSADALSALRAELEGSAALFAVAYLGFMDMEPQGYLNEWIAESNPALAEKYPFMAQIPDARTVGTVGEVYCIVPGSGEASVLVELLSFEGMDYVGDFFDSFYLKREYNRNFEKITKAREWCDQNGKKLFALANSGCLNFCSTHTFHDNLVAHESELMQKDNAYTFRGVCQSYLGNPEKRSSVIKDTNFIRPEDIKLYEGLFDGMKLATRVSRDPAKIINAYCKGYKIDNLKIRRII